ncbi:F0F1 ATP synthase subunit A [Aminipila terrae]|uniref:ATP synthase subunit a n=1 Tax=Aminipila terrae TaxID=2697030 RepID=A0A6P1MK80_9FIRM|nr:F0F1 ATP synthase subunit A [Aminipila terrae]QHI72448.1 F0F1 ATP synthase subunit A [Aminipila terrae]
MIEMLNSMGITNAMITSSVITLILCFLAIVASRHMEMIPSGLQNVIEVIVEKLSGFFEDLMGEYAGRKYFPLVATLFIYVLICNYTGLLPLSGELPGLKAPTSSINFPAGLAIIVFFCVQFIGIRETHGLKYYKHLLQPIVFLFPLMLLEDIVKPISLTLRLYGNIFGEEAVTSAFFGMVPFGLPILMQAFSVLMGLIQAMVFSLLAGIYISEAAEHGAEEHERLKAQNI